MGKYKSWWVWFFVFFCMKKAETNRIDCCEQSYWSPVRMWEVGSFVEIACLTLWISISAKEGRLFLCETTTDKFLPSGSIPSLFVYSIHISDQQSNSLGGKILCVFAVIPMWFESQCILLLLFTSNDFGMVISSNISQYYELISSLVDVRIFLVLKFNSWNLAGQCSFC